MRRHFQAGAAGPGLSTAAVSVQRRRGPLGLRGGRQQSQPLTSGRAAPVNHLDTHV